MQPLVPSQAEERTVARSKGKWHHLSPTSVNLLFSRPCERWRSGEKSCCEAKLRNGFPSCKKVKKNSCQKPASPSPSPSAASAASPSAGGCLTQPGDPCVFPFTWRGVTHRSCTTAGGFPVAWCSTRTDGAGTHQTGHYGDCDTQTDCALEADCRTVRSVL